MKSIYLKFIYFTNLLRKKLLKCDLKISHKNNTTTYKLLFDWIKTVWDIMIDSWDLWLFEPMYRRNLDIVAPLHDHYWTDSDLNDIIGARWQRLYLRYFSFFSGQCFWTFCYFKSMVSTQLTFVRSNMPEHRCSDLLLFIVHEWMMCFLQ